MASAAAPAPARDFQFFAEIIEGFKLAGESSNGGKANDMQVTPFVSAMTLFLRIFDAFSNPFFSEVVKKDVEGNIKKLRTAAVKFSATTIEQVLDEEAKDPKLKKLIKSESGAGAESGTVALLWMKRTMQFVIGLLQGLVDDSKVTLSSASRKSYASTLRYCHNILTRGVFDTGLRFAPSRESFFKNLAGGSNDISQVNVALAEFLSVFQPQLNGIVAMYKEKGLEPYIK